MKPFDHRNAKTVEEAVKLLREYKGKAKLIAGGTDLLGTLKDNILPDYPEALINLKTIPGMDYTEKDGAGLRIGALARLSAIAQSPLVNCSSSILAQAAESVASPQIRRMATIGGNLCQDLRCWYYRYPHHVGGRIDCHMKGGNRCPALTGENQYHSIFGASPVGSPPCSSQCPGTMDIPRYLSMIREGDLAAAAQVVLDTNPLPSITGRVCPHFCEEECGRCAFDESVSIGGIERFMGDYICKQAGEIMKPEATDTGKTVAIVGAGPAGLSAAYYLRRYGHRVTVFERMEAPGGMLAYAIPAYRLPRDVVRRAVQSIEKAGVTFRLNVDVGKNITLGELQRDFHSVFLATGAWKQPSAGIEGEDLTQSGLEFLAQISRGGRKTPGKKIVVIGGGNVAVDAAVSAKRLGAEEVTIVYRRTREEMPALKREVEEALAEGIKLVTSRAPVKVLQAQGTISGIEVVRSATVRDDQGSIALQLDDSEKESIEADHIIMAVGQTPDLSFLKAEALTTVKGNLLAVDSQTQETNIPGLFAGGDATLGPATVIEAIAAGRRAAIAINRYLGGKEARQAAKAVKEGAFLAFNPEYLKKTSRAQSASRPLRERGIDLEDALGLSLGQIEEEANRCFNCGCVAVNSSDLAVALLALDAKVKIARRRGLVAIQDLFDPSGTVDSAWLVTEILVPEPPENARQAFLKFRLREAIDFPIVSVATVITLDQGVCRDARIVLGGVAPTPIRATAAERALKGKPLDEATAEGSAEAAVRGALPLANNAYKVQVAKTLVKRAILSCVV